jgi:hypothetical protein
VIGKMKRHRENKNYIIIIWSVVFTLCFIGCETLTDIMLAPSIFGGKYSSKYKKDGDSNNGSGGGSGTSDSSSSSGCPNGSCHIVWDGEDGYLDYCRDLDCSVGKVPYPIPDGTNVYCDCK